MIKIAAVVVLAGLAAGQGCVGSPDARRPERDAADQGLARFDAALVRSEAGTAQAGPVDGRADGPSVDNGSSMVDVDAGRADASALGAADAATMTGPRRRSGKRHHWVVAPSAGAPVTFMMGSPADRPCQDPWNAGRETQHAVTLSRPFEIATEEVTQAQFAGTMGYNPSARACEDCPVETVTWSEAAAYCNALSIDEDGTSFERCYECSGAGKGMSCAPKRAHEGSGIYDCAGYRLPTEAEFELAYRAGTTTDLYNGDLTTCDAADPRADEIAVYRGNSDDRTHPVGSRAPNAWGLYDMAGNVWNWCHDRFGLDLGAQPVTDPGGSADPAVTARAVRGGSYHYYGTAMRASTRLGEPPTFTSPATGFRCVRTRR